MQAISVIPHALVSHNELNALIQNLAWVHRVMNPVIIQIVVLKAIDHPGSFECLD